MAQSTYYVKSIVKHSGSLGYGHYTAALNTYWWFVDPILRDEAKELKKTEEPLDGYLYFYEKMGCQKMPVMYYVSGDLIDSLHLLFDNQRPAESMEWNNMKKVQRKGENVLNANYLLKNTWTMKFLLKKRKKKNRQVFATDSNPRSSENCCCCDWNAPYSTWIG